MKSYTAHASPSFLKVYDTVQSQIESFTKRGNTEAGFGNLTVSTRFGNATVELDKLNQSKTKSDNVNPPLQLVGESGFSVARENGHFHTAKYV